MWYLSLRVIDSLFGSFDNLKNRRDENVTNEAINTEMGTSHSNLSDQMASRLLIRKEMASKIMKLSR